ncbi:hypothetical protein [Pseudoalteromonas marina]|uniref:Uncharacterized protein n=1 Tax=Pseudoalteromonas marina TaxID=267375 RepID=A0ABT9FHW1_9GAMM|nr:hypothetical protein [Pseudoalteromonas marina]MDP2566377.1 hypothetical protein [Pseudoalteromonas marina]
MIETIVGWPSTRNRFGSAALVETIKKYNRNLQINLYSEEIDVPKVRVISFNNLTDVDKYVELKQSANREVAAGLSIYVIDAKEDIKHSMIAKKLRRAGIKTHHHIDTDKNGATNIKTTFSAYKLANQIAEIQKTNRLELNF